MFGYASASSSKSEGEQGEVKPITAEDAYLILENASSVLVVPGYGMAVAQAQHVVRELGELLEKMVLKLNMESIPLQEGCLVI